VIDLTESSSAGFPALGSFIGGIAAVGFHDFGAIRRLDGCAAAIGGCAPATYSQQGYSVQPGTVVHDSGYNTNAGYGGGFGTGECRST
jgi:hypothetical protein